MKTIKIFSTIAVVVLAMVIMGAVSCKNTKTEKKAVVYVSSADLKQWALQAGKDSTNADMVPVYYNIADADKSKAVALYSLGLADDKKSGNLVPTFVGDSTADKEVNLLFYANPMYPSDFSNTPKKDDMSMDYVGVYGK